MNYEVHPEVNHRREREGRDAWTSARCFIGKHASALDFEVVKTAKYTGMSAAGVLILQSTTPIELRRVIAEGGRKWLAGPGALLGVAAIEVSSIERTEMHNTTEAVTVTVEQLRQALVSMLGNAPQVTVRNVGKFLPKVHNPISRESWQAAAKAEGLEIEGEKPWGLSIWKSGVKKQAVVAMTWTKSSGLHPVSETQPLQPEPTDSRHLEDPEQIATAARAHMDAENKAGRRVELTEAVRHVMKHGKTIGPSGRVGGHSEGNSNENQPQSGAIFSGLQRKDELPVTPPSARWESGSDQQGHRHRNGPVSLPDMRKLAPGPHQAEAKEPEALALRARDIQRRENLAGRKCSAEKAVRTVLAGSQDTPEENAHRIADFVASEAANGRTCTASEAAQRLGIK
jgi:hypothetical protein